MSVALTVTNSWSDGKRLHVIGTLTFSGNYATNGDALSLVNEKIKSTTVRYVNVKGLSAQYKYAYSKAAGKVLVTDEDQTSGITAELAAGAHPAGITGDTIDFYGIFDQLK